MFSFSDPSSLKLRLDALEQPNLDLQLANPDRRQGSLENQR